MGENKSGEEAPKEDNDIASSLRSKYAAKEAPAKRGRKKKVEEVGPSGMTYTPLEKQYMEIKEQWPDVLLLMEGEHVARPTDSQLVTSTSNAPSGPSDARFHGDDAKSASKELGIAA